MRPIMRSHRSFRARENGLMMHWAARLMPTDCAAAAKHNYSRYSSRSGRRPAKQPDVPTVGLGLSRRCGKTVEEPNAEMPIKACFGIRAALHNKVPKSPLHDVLRSDLRMFGAQTEEIWLLEVNSRSRRRG